MDRYKGITTERLKVKYHDLHDLNDELDRHDARGDYLSDDLAKEAEAVYNELERRRFNRPYELSVEAFSLFNKLQTRWLNSPDDERLRNLSRRAGLRFSRRSAEYKRSREAAKSYE